MASNEQTTFPTILSSIVITMGTLSFFANFMQLFFICHDKKQRNSVFGIILLSLCVADLIVSIVLFNIGMNNLLKLFLVIDWTLYNKLKLASDIAIIFSVASSLCHIVFIAVLRVLALVFPFKIKQIITKLRCKIILVFLWLFSIGFMLIRHFIKIYILSHLAIMASCILLLAYSIICYRMCKRRDILGNEATQRSRQQSDRYVLLYSITLTVIFCTCILPRAFSSFMKFSRARNYISTILYSLNPFLDPLLYFFANYFKQKRVNIVLPDKNRPDRVATRAINGKSKIFDETRL